MVEGLSPRKIVVVDLDGSLLKGNSLVCYVKTLWCHMPPAKRMRMAWWIGLRRMRLVSHRRMKFALLKLGDPTEEIQADFVARVTDILNPFVANLIQEYKKNGARIILATAAPDIYVPWIWKGEFIATLTHGNDAAVECRGTEKLKAVKKLMNPGDILEAVITDHHDDLPLLSAGARRNILVNPSARTLFILRGANIPFQQI